MINRSLIKWGFDLELLLGERYIKFDLEPSEYAELQLKKILVLKHHGLQIIKMKKRFGGAVYYRDRADADKGDNLLFLPRYKSQRA